ncbi:MAG: galactose-1-phosphate uridylyltransferase [Acidobacteriota bacterium]|nr:galactose-1-phosphate uridylyltransferase [Acidobacteriota bacterium]
MPELRKDPVTERWVIIATDRARRPSDFSREHATPFTDRFCPFCPGNETKTAPEVYAAREGSNWLVRVVPNKFPLLGIDGSHDRDAEGLYDRMNGLGAHEVIIETPVHTETLSTMGEGRMEAVIWAWRSRVTDLKNDRRLRYILLFKNHGEAAGATQEHAHSQLIALPVVPKRVTEEIEGASRYYQFKERCIFCDMLRQESKGQTRVVTETDRFLVMEPFAARFPFETWILPTRHNSHFETIDAAEVRNLAQVLRGTLRKMDKVLENPAFNFIVHTAPVQERAMDHYHWHIEIIPKLTKVAGFEWGTGFYINPTPPEEAALFLREA